MCVQALEMEHQRNAERTYMTILQQWLHAGHGCKASELVTLVYASKKFAVAETGRGGGGGGGGG